MDKKTVYELVTPLTLIRGYAGLLRDGELGLLSQEQREILKIIICNSERLSVVVRKLVDRESGETGFPA